MQPNTVVCTGSSWDHNYNLLDERIVGGPESKIHLAVLVAARESSSNLDPRPSGV
ncbi:MAG: hypothetical protein WKF86_05990 [Acidimicrobiales bacterium]